MKNHWLLALLAGLSIFSNVFACDLCSTYIGINPGDFKSSFTMIHRLRNFQKDEITQRQRFTTLARINHLTTDGYSMVSQENSYRESFQSFDLRARIALNPRLLLDVMTTFAENYKYTNDSLTNTVSGIGDLQLMAQYRLYNSMLSYDSTNWVNRLTVGGGIKLPTGRFNEPGLEDNFDPHLQPGSGSLDFLVMLDFISKFKKIGVNANVIYKINSTNRNDFHFANRFNSNLILFYLTEGDKLKLMPNAGLSYESAERDLDKGSEFLGSGGQALFLTAGLRVFKGNFSLGTTLFFKPLNEDLYDQTIQLNNQSRIITELSYFF